MQSFRSMRSCIFTAALVTAACTAIPARAQVLYGSIVGTVVDPSGAAVPNADVNITNTQTGQSRSDKTNPDGRYLFGNVLPGIYNVKISAAGFRTFAQNEV